MKTQKSSTQIVNFLPNVFISAHLKMRNWDHFHQILGQKIEVESQSKMKLDQ